MKKKLLLHVIDEIMKILHLRISDVNLKKKKTNVHF